MASPGGADLTRFWIASALAGLRSLSPVPKVTRRPSPVDAAALLALSEIGGGGGGAASAAGGGGGATGAIATVAGAASGKVAAGGAAVAGGGGVTDAEAGAVGGTAVGVAVACRGFGTPGLAVVWVCAA